MNLFPNIFLGVLLTAAACGRSRTAEEWELAVPVRLHQPPRAPAADPEAPLRLMPREPGADGPKAGTPLVFLQDGGAWRLLDDQARIVFSAPVPVTEDDPQPVRTAAAFHSAGQRMVYLLYRQELFSIPVAQPQLRRVAALGDAPLCAFEPPFDQHLLHEDDLGEDPARGVLCAVLRDAPAPDCRRACTLAVNPADGVVKSACTRDDQGRAGRPVEPPPCASRPAPERTPGPTGWRPDGAACALVETAGGRVLPLYAETDEPSPCELRFEGSSADGRFAIWCTAEPETEYAGGRCRVVDLRRGRALEPAVDVPWESRVRWDALARAALVGDFLFLLDASPVRYVELNASALFVR